MINLQVKLEVTDLRYSPGNGDDAIILLKIMLNRPCMWAGNTGKFSWLSSSFLLQRRQIKHGMVSLACGLTLQPHPCNWPTKHFFSPLDRASFNTTRSYGLSLLASHIPVLTFVSFADIHIMWEKLQKEGSCGL